MSFVGYETESNLRLYSNWRTKYEDLFESEKHFLETALEPKMTMLDIGCACGGIGNALSSKVKYTGIDVDRKAINLGKKLFKDLELLCGDFSLYDFKERKFDFVFMTGLFPQLPNWKDTLLEMVKLSNRFICVSLVSRLSGTTVVDKDVSYMYYLNSGERTYQVVQSLCELINFCCIHEIRAKRVSFYGYHKESLPKSLNRRCVIPSEQVVGNLLIEILPKDISVKRTGGVSHKDAVGFVPMNLSPQVEVIIDGKRRSEFE